jgi:NMD protein affecting ribosome stability and mRNA decay
MLNVIDWVQRYSESALENLWKEFQETLQEYIRSTEDKRNQYAKLKVQDEMSSETISKQSKTLTYFYVSVNCYTCDRLHVELDYIKNVSVF